jgi:transcriptional regulator with XRE-family HTH domain
MDIGTKLKERRQALGKTLEDVGKEVGVGKSTVRKWEQGMIKNMRRDKIALLAQALEICPAEIIDYQPQIPESISEDDRQLIAAYRAADPGTQAAVRKLLDIAPPSEERSAM